MHKTETTFTISLHGDRAIKQRDEDMLGFYNIAEQISTALVDHKSNGGLVVGLEGPWGSGKSSLLFLIEDVLETLPFDKRPTVINFQPWLIGNREALLANLFTALGEAIAQVALEAGDASAHLELKAKEAVSALYKFTQALSKAGALVEVVGDATSFAPLKWAGVGLSSLSKLEKGEASEPGLDDLKENLIRTLQDLKHRFIIVIDDVDRLEPKEVIEILRVTRAVADFPNVIYLLSYDGAILAHNVKQATQVEDGFSYLEKIVQLTVMVPKPEPLRLRQWFSDELHKIASAKDENDLQNLKLIIDYDGGRYLTSPRSVVRVLDSIRFHWPTLQKQNANLADLVWLQFIKVANPKLYRWIEGYCATAAEISLGRVTVSDEYKMSEHAALVSSVSPDHFNDPMYRDYFAQRLPAMTANFIDKGNLFELYQPVNIHDLYSAISNCKLSSPDHYRLYFALSSPSHALKFADFESFWNATDDGAENVEALLLNWHTVSLSESLSKADLLLERIINLNPPSITDTRAVALLTSLSNTMDQAFRIRPFDIWWVNSLWDRANKLVTICLSHLKDDERKSTLELMFKNGKAISWLTKLFRRELFSHGIYGDRNKPKAEWLFTGPELDLITNAMLSRYSALTKDDIFEAISLFDLLFAWQQGGDTDGPRRMIERCIETNEGMIRVLNRLTSTIRSSDRGVFPILKKEDLSSFLDYNDVQARVIDLQQDKDLGSQAKILKKAFDDGKDY